MSLGSPVCLPLSRSAVQAAAEEVYAAGPRAPGCDGQTHRDAFGDGVGSPEFVSTVSALCSYRHAYRFGALRLVEFHDPISGKSRVIGVPILRDKIILRALNNEVRLYAPPKAMNVSRPGLDTRASVVLAAQVRREHPLQPALRLDIRSAFPSLDWRQALATPAAGMIPAELKMALAGVFDHFSPTGIGVPMGLSMSPLVLDLALAEADDYVATFNRPAYRYMDDYIVLGISAESALKLMDGVAERVAENGLSLSAGKSRPFDRSVPWLGHDIAYDGAIDIGAVAHERVRALLKIGGRENGKRIGQILRSFILGRKGDSFQSLIRDIPGIETDLSEDPVTPPQERRNKREGMGEEAREDHGKDHGEEHGEEHGKEHAEEHGKPCKGDRPGRQSKVWSHSYRSSHRMASEQTPPGGQATETCPTNSSLPDRLPTGGRSGRYRRSSSCQNLVEIFGSYAGLLKFADAWKYTGTRRDSDAEGRILFGSPAKAQQFVRAYQLWQHALASLERAGRRLTTAQNEALLSRVWPVLMCAATITVIEAFKVCKDDPLEVLLQAIGGKSIKECKAALVAERLARQDGQRPKRWSRYADLMAHEVEEWNAGWDMEAERNRVAHAFRTGRRSNKFVGVREEDRVAHEVGGKRVPGSGAGDCKSDVETVDSQIEVKSTAGGRWLVPIYQLDQLRRSGKRPVVILAGRGKNEFVLIHSPWVDQSGVSVVDRRAVTRHQRSLSISRGRYARLLSDESAAVAFDIGVRGVWILMGTDKFDRQARTGADRDEKAGASPAD